MKKLLYFLLLLCLSTMAQDYSYQKKYTHFIALNSKDYATINAFFEADKNDTIKLQYAFEKSKLLKAENIQSYLANTIGVFYRDISNYKKALWHHKYALALSQKTKNNLLEIISFNMLGVVYRRMDAINLAMENHQNALQIIENTKSTSDNLLMCKAVSLNSLGNIYLTLNQHDLALQTFQKTLAIEKARNNKIGVAINYENIGGVYENQNKLDLALVNYKKSLSCNNNDIGDLICNNNIGTVLLKQGHPHQALLTIYPTIAIANRLKDDFYTSNAYINLGWAYLTLGRFSKAKSNIQIGLKIASNKKFPSYQATAYRLLSEIAEKQHQFQLSSYYLRLYYSTTEKVSGAKNQKCLFDYIMKYENQKKETAIKLKDREIKIYNLRLESNKKEKIFFIAGICLMAIIGTLLFKQSQNRKKNNQKLQLLNQELNTANKTKTRFFSILNHDLRGPVANLIHFLHLQKNDPGLLDEESKKRLENQTILGAENLLCTMEDLLLWSKGQMQNFKPHPKKITVNQLFEDTKKVFSGYQNIQFEYYDPDTIALHTDENYLKTIMRNLTSNAINVFGTTPNSKIIWKAWQTNQKTYLSITDNGPGASLDKFRALYDDTLVVGIKSGLGLHLIRDLAKAIDCTIEIESVINQKTCFTLIL